MDCFGIVEQSRICKSQYELDVMKKAAFATKAGMQAGLDAVQAGVTENEIGGEISRAMFAAGGEIPSVMPYVTSGPRTMIGHASWEGRTVQPGEHVFIEVAGSYRKYHTAMMRTAICGEISDSMYEAQEVMKKALNWLQSELRPGVTVSDVDRMVRSILHENKVGARLITRSGYSIGIAFPPSWDEGYILSLNQGQSDILKPGMTFHIIPWLWGVDGDKTCGISDTFYITEDGCGSFFQDFERDFVVKPDVSKAVGDKSVTSITAPKSPITEDKKVEKSVKKAK
jgi:Xaa-Pro dipeptidase